MDHERWIPRVLRALPFLRERDGAVRLLKENLTAQQRHDYETHGYFHVVGGSTRKRYRVRHGKTLNVDELGPRGELISKLCFSPKGGLSVGEVLLAQKLALELFETATLKVASRHCPNRLAIP
jgi:hypothetical protein